MGEKCKKLFISAAAIPKTDYHKLILHVYGVSWAELHITGSIEDNSNIIFLISQ